MVKVQTVKQYPDMTLSISYNPDGLRMTTESMKRNISSCDVTWKGVSAELGHPQLL